jgi:hypothetical protein
VHELDKELLWALRRRLGAERRQVPQTLFFNSALLEWVVRGFRSQWPLTGHPRGSSWGDKNEWDASEFILQCIQHLSADTSSAAETLLIGLAKDPIDSYTPHIQHSLGQHRKIVREQHFQGIQLGDIKAIIERQSPKSTDDLRSIVLHVLKDAQGRFRGSNTDAVRKYYADGKKPQNEDWCTDRLIEDIEHQLKAYGISTTPQGDMPADKRVDILFSVNDIALPVECKGQWHRELWSAANDQLDTFYSRDWRAQDRGIYIVYWFGQAVETKYRPKGPPSGIGTPTNPDELRSAIVELIPQNRRSSISVVVLDMTL